MKDKNWKDGRKNSCYMKRLEETNEVVPWSWIPSVILGLGFIALAVVIYAF